MKKVIVIVTKSGTKYTIGLEKSVNTILNEIHACKSEFYNFVDQCAIRISEIASIEQFEINVSNDKDCVKTTTGSPNSSTVKHSRTFGGGSVTSKNKRKGNKK